MLNRILFPVLAATLSLAASAWAQFETATILGFVRDPAQASVPGARVRLENLGTGQQIEKVTDESGYFEFPLLRIGRYRITVEKDGFATATISEVEATVAARRRVDVELRLGQVAEQVTVAEAAALGDEEARRAIYTEVNELLKQHVPMIPIAHGASAAAYKATVEGAHASPLGNESLEVMYVPGQDTFTFMQNAEPIGLYCADETDGESLRVCEQVLESLLAYTDATEWTFKLRQGVKFHDGSTLDANDVVLSWVVQWDAAHPLHKGRVGDFAYFSGLFGAFLNAPQ